MAKVYVADDEKNIRDLIASFLRDQGLEVEVFETGDQLLLRFLEEAADVVILDIMMPGTSGIDIAAMLRKRSEVPIILLTARDSDDDFVKGFSAGVDDYFTKPFSPLKLSLRVKAILARQPVVKDGANEEVKSLAYEGLEISDKERSASYQGKTIKLTNTEFELLKVLLSHSEEAVSRDDLLHLVWGYESDVETRVTDEPIKRLRKKMRGVESHVLIETIWGYGFKLTAKKIKKDNHLTKKKRWQSRFRTTLFLQPLTILITSFAIILLVFNGLLKLFLAEEAFTAIQNEYDTLDALYVGEDLPKISDGNIFETTYAIVDEKFDIKYISASTYDLSEKQISEKVVDYFSDNKSIDWFDDEFDNSVQHFKKVKVYDSTYMVKMQEYPGTFSESYIKQDSDDSKSQNYYVFVFANVTPIADFETYINYLLLSLMVIVWFDCYHNHILNFTEIR